jgi:prolyl-tRNA editing enzyme YbaK/EbsC (Cys-tRNA(Pro) deacylase)
MSLQSVKDFFAANAPDIHVIELGESTATVELAARGHGVLPAQIAKTLCLKVNDQPLLVVTSGTSRLDNKKAKAAFGGKPKMPEADEVAALTGHPVGGVCPFGLAQPLPIYCDVSLKAFDEVIPAAGSTHSALRISPMRMAELTHAEWVDVCQEPQVAPAPAAQA